MDFIFEDEVDEVGSDVEAYCPKCKADTTHVVISKYEDEIRRVQCNPCGDVHSFRKPRGETEDDVPEPVAARKRALLKKPGWTEFFAKKNPNDARPYEFREQYRENVIVTHPKFGVGFVSEVVSDSKVEITFEDARRILVHNRRDIPALPLAAEGDGMPTPPKSSKPAKAAKAPKAEAARADAKSDSEGATPAPASKRGGKAAAASAAAEEAGEAKAGPTSRGGKAEKAAAKVETAPAKGGKPDLKLVKGGAAAKGAAAAKTAKPPAKEAPKAAAAKAAPKVGKGKAGKGATAAAAKSPGKASKSGAAPRGSKTASKPAAKKPAPKPKKKAGKKR